MSDKQIPISRVHAAIQQSRVREPMATETALPLTDLDPPVFERLCLEFLRIYVGARQVHAYGRKGQKQYGIDIVGNDSGGRRFVCQVRRIEQPRSKDIETAVKEFAEPGDKHWSTGDYKGRRFSPERYFLAVAAPLDADASIVDKIIEMQTRYAEDLDVEVCGSEVISPRFHDQPGLVNSLFGPAWSRTFCGVEPPATVDVEATSLGLLEGPLEELGLQAASDRALQLAADDPASTAEIDEDIAEQLVAAGYPGHARVFLRRAADSHRRNRTFGRFLDLATNDLLLRYESGAPSSNDFLHRITWLPHFESSRLQQEDRETAEFLSAVFSWHESGLPVSQIVELFPGEIVKHSDSAVELAAVIGELAVSDEIFEGVKPFVGDERSQNFSSSDLTRLLDLLSETLDRTSNELLRVRLRCSIADGHSRLRYFADDSPSASAEFADLERDSHIGRLGEATAALALARSARAHLSESSKFRAIELYREAIVKAHSAGHGGDVRDYARALSSVIDSVHPSDLSSDPVQRVGQLGLLKRPDVESIVAALGNKDRFLYPESTAQLSALESVHFGRYDRGFSACRRAVREARIRAALVEEQLAYEVFADDLKGAKRFAGAARAIVRANKAKTAAIMASSTPEWVGSLHELQHGSTWVRQTAAAVVGEQWHLVPEEELEDLISTLIENARGIWQSDIIRQSPMRRSLEALARLGNRVPDSLLEPVLDLIEEGLDGSHALSQDLIRLLARILHESDDMRAASALVRIGQSEEARQQLWNTSMQLDVKEPIRAFAEACAEEGDVAAAVLLAKWDRPTQGSMVVVRTMADELLRTQVLIDRQVFRVGNLRLRVHWLVCALMRHPHLDIATAEPGSSSDPMQPEAAATRATENPATLAQKVLRKYVDLALDVSDSSTNRDQAFRGLSRMLREIPPAMWTDQIQRLTEGALTPTLNPNDEFELSTLDPLSSSTIDTGARTLEALSLCIAGEAVELASREDSLGAWSEIASQLGSQAERLLRSGDSAVEELASAALATLSPLLRDTYPILARHPNQEVRKNATGTWNDFAGPVQPFGHLLLDDAPDVRASVALLLHSNRLGEDRKEEIRSALKADKSFIVRRKLASTMQQPRLTLTED